MAKPTWKDYVLYKRKLIERHGDEKTKLETIKKLQKVPITIQLLQETGIGKVMKQLCKENGRIGEKANALLAKWKDSVAVQRASSNNKSEETICNNDRSSGEMGNKTGSQKNKKSPNGHERINGTLPSKHSSHKHHRKEHSSSLMSAGEEPHKVSAFYDEPDIYQPNSQDHMASGESPMNSVEDDDYHEAESSPHSNRMSKYTSCVDYVQFGANEYNPEYPALYSKSNNKCEDLSGDLCEQEEQECLVELAENGILSRECVESGSPRMKNKSSEFNIKSSTASSKRQHGWEGESSGSQSKHRSSSSAQNGSFPSKPKHVVQNVDSSMHGKHKSDARIQDSSKYKEKNSISPLKHHSSKSSAPNGSLKRRQCEENDSSGVKMKHYSSSSSSQATMSSSKSAEKHRDQTDSQPHKKIKTVDVSKISKSSSSSGSSKLGLENHSSKTSVHSSSSLNEFSIKESNKALKVSEKLHKEKSSSSLKGKSKESGKSSSKSKTGKTKASLSLEVEGFTATEASFEDCLGFNDIVSVKKKKSSSKPGSSPHSPKDKHSKISSSKESSKNSAKNSTKTMSSKNHVKNEELPPKPKSVSKPVTDLPKDKNKIKKKSKEVISEPPETFEVPKPPEMEVDIMSTLPEIQPNYKPLPYRPDSPVHRKTALTDAEAIMFTSSRKEKTAVYSGRKNHYITEVSSLFDLCTRVLIENIDGIGYVGGVPYMILKPILERCSPKQLYTIEDFNAYLLEDTGELWEQHCMRTYRGKSPDPGETWRDLFIRLHDEQESRLKSVTRNISVSMSKATPVRQTKLAYVDSVVKPPRDIARKQARHGTALPVNHTMKPGPPSKASPRPTAPGINAASSPKPSSPVPPCSNSAAKSIKRTAPLMMKTLKDLKKAFRR